MKFKHGTRRLAIEYEKDWVKRWKADKTFEKSIENRSKDNSYVFYDGPPFISGVPHHGTLLSSIVKDAVPRYWTMKGKRVERVWGWDCHGLPAERFTEKKLGIKSREEVLEYGIEKYINATRENMVQTSGLWEEYVDRVGRWVDFKGAYKTMDRDYMESIWWAFKTLYEKGKIYEGEKVLMYCTLDGTPLSKAEVTMDAGAYQDITDPSVYVKFKMKKPIKKAVAFYIENEQGEFSAVLRCEDDESLPNVWGLAAATLKEDETEEKAVMRAAKDKLGIITNEMVFTGSDKLEREDYFLELSEYHIVSYSGKPALQGGKQYYAKLAWQSNPNILQEAASKGSLCSRIFLRNHSLEFEDKTTDFSRQQRVLLAWTTTPWTLPANTALAVNEKLTYVEVKVDDEQFIIAKELVGKVLQDEKHQPLEYEVLREMKGKDLVGLSYEPLLGVDRGEGAHKVWAADYVSHEDGTGIVHLAPAYGEEDFEFGKQHKIPVVHTIDENGMFTESDWKGENVWDINKIIAKMLHERGIVWKIDYIRHPYPHCHRCGTKLMYRAHPSWFMDIDSQRQKMLEKNQPINWFPEHLKHGRFEKTVEQAPDWNISRDRFWATAMPVWKSESGKVRVVGSYAELKELSGKELDDYHRPWIDDITFEIDGETYTRIDKVMDSWFEAGSMPFAKLHYPFENKEKFEANFPGDFIVEYIAQTRAWFYYMHAVSVALFGENSFKNVITTGTLAGSDGRKMSKSLNNFTDPNELMDKFSADAERFLLLSSPVLNGEDFSLQDKEVGDTARKLSMIWNMYDFFTMYAEVDGWEYSPEEIDITAFKNPMDRWIISRYRELRDQITKNMDEYNIPDAMSGIFPFLDDASNWYVRRSRRRFWKSEDDNDKNDAYRTLHYILRHLSYVLAPFTPFLAEELHHNLVGGESVHLLDWPNEGHIDQIVLDEMATVRGYVNEGLSLRAKAGLKVRQPLASVTVSSFGVAIDFASILKEELNVKVVKTGKAVSIDEKITPKLKREGFIREVIRHVQAARKKAGLNVDDRIHLGLITEDKELQQAVTEHAEIIKQETLADGLKTSGKLTHEETVRIEDKELTINLVKRGE